MTKLSYLNNNQEVDILLKILLYTLALVIFSSCENIGSLIKIDLMPPQSDKKNDENYDENYDNDKANQITVSAYHSCAIFTTKEVKCWGNNSSGQLGDGTNTNRLTPTLVNGLTSKIRQISTASHHTCAVDSVGDVFCWGKNNSGQLGDGTTTTKFAPTKVIGLSSKAIKVIANDEFWGNYGWTCAQVDTGNIQCWGDMPFGLGDGLNTSSPLPVTVIGSTGAKNFAISSSHGCFINASDGVNCWGGSRGGKLGDGQEVSSPLPVSISLTNAIDISVTSSGWDNDGFSCAVLSDNSLKCWGETLSVSSTVPSTFPGILNAKKIYTALASGATLGHACYLNTSDSLFCWGYNQYSVLGDGTINNQATPISINVFSGPISSFSNHSDGGNGAGHSCAMKADDTIKCWGLNTYGQLGDNTTIDRFTP